jgi:hypothetical protein
MKQWIAAALVAFVSAANAGVAFLDGVLQTGNGSAANAYDFGALDASPSTLAVTTFGRAGSSFEEYANFSIAQDSVVSGVANTYTLSFFGIDLLDIDNLLIEVWDNAHPNGGTLLGSFGGNNATTGLGSLAAGDYHLDISGTFGARAFGGQYSVSLAAVPAVPEPSTYALMLAGIGAIAFVARRRRSPAA